MSLSPDIRHNIARRIRAAVPEVRQVLLFGSQARGDAQPDSDVDLMVITSESVSRTAVGVTVRRSLWGLPFGFDLRVVTESEWRQLCASRAWFDREMVHDAVRLDGVA